MNKGLLIVLEGIDGSGKSTQVDLLSNYFKDKNIPFQVVSFPQYGKNEHAKKITDYLEGRLGKLSEVDSYTMAEVYASDRQTVKDQINNWLSSGKLVIANRYVSSSKAHLGANLSEDEREKFINWLDQLEYQTNEMPRPNLTIFLKVDSNVGQQNALKDHLKDIHEESLTHEEKAAKIYFELSQIEENWVVVDCMKDEEMKSKEEIHKDIIKLLEDKIFTT